MKFYNLMSGCGFTESCGFSMGFVGAWIGLTLLMIIVMLGKKWLGEEEVSGFPYNWYASILGSLVYIFIVSFTGSSKWSLLFGIIGTLGSGFGAGSVFGGTSE